MMKFGLSLLMAGGLLLLASAPVSAQTWKCDFKGSYTEDGEKKAFTWKVTWVESESGSDKLTGTAVDADGRSSTVGTCDDMTCLITENAGDKKYYWVGTYADAETKNENVYITTIKGTWGPSPSDRKSLGTWEAKADCKR